MYRWVGAKSRRRGPGNRGFWPLDKGCRHAARTSSIGLSRSAERGLARRRQLGGILSHAFLDAAAARRHAGPQSFVVFLAGGAQRTTLVIGLVVGSVIPLAVGWNDGTNRQCGHDRQDSQGHWLKFQPPAFDGGDAMAGDHGR